MGTTSTQPERNQPLFSALFFVQAQAPTRHPTISLVHLWSHSLTTLCKHARTFFRFHQVIPVRMGTPSEISAWKQCLSKFTIAPPADLISILKRASIPICLSIFRGYPIYQTLLDLPPGHTQTYAQISKTTHLPPRSIAHALRYNPLPPLIPCHRILPKTGGIGGYTPLGPTFKHYLLTLEKLQTPGTLLHQIQFVSPDCLMNSFAKYPSSPQNPQTKTKR